MANRNKYHIRSDNQNRYNAYKHIGDKQYKINIKKNFGFFWSFYTAKERTDIFKYLKFWDRYADLHTIGQLAFVGMEMIEEALNSINQHKEGRSKLRSKTKYILRWKGIPL